MLEGELPFVDGSLQKPMRANIVTNECSPDGRSVCAALKANDGRESSSLGGNFS